MPDTRLGVAEGHSLVKDIQKCYGLDKPVLADRDALRVRIRKTGSSANVIVVAPALGDPGSAPREFRLFPSPRDGQTVGQGQPAEFFVNVRGYEGFTEPVSFSIDH